MGQPQPIWHENVLLAGTIWGGEESLRWQRPVICLVDATWFVVDHMAHKRVAGMERRRLFEKPIASVVRVEVEGWSAERSEYGWRWTTGLLHAAAQISATTGVTVHTTDGGWALFKLNGPPVAVKPRIDGLLRLVGMAETSATQLPPPVPASLAAQLRQLAELHAAGVLTEDEFAAAKARLLGP